ncbi:conserved exported protein of unknown function [Magnetospirillum sp. XM-1]|uniref:hypothetical protein n=1 Tax=Magnetospirillum sp. XM-1 TaxID=1663591 RepID=UPI00073E07E8|nr:hypothetical protein [Magnetospirillum sp. XM-1]CUW38404.1 conserved exported protein of unknown function [Magnetospirillum sp. XM-1]
MTMRKLALLCALSLAAATALPATAQIRQPGRPAQTPEPSRGSELTERLLLLPPAGWQEAGTVRGQNALTTHLFPPGQNAEKWNEMLSIQVMGDARADAREHIQRIVEASRTNCEASGPSPVTEGMVNGYPVSTLTVTCTKGRQSGLGGLVAVKAIRGAQALYVVQRIWRGQPFERNSTAPVSSEMLKEWSEFLRGVAVCDEADPQRHPCPK